MPAPSHQSRLSRLCQSRQNCQAVRTESFFDLSCCSKDAIDGFSENRGAVASLWVTAERLPQFLALWPGVRFDPPIVVPAALAQREWSAEEALVEILHDSSREDAQIPVQRLQTLLENYNNGVGALRLVARGISPTTIAPLRVSDRDLATPEARRPTAER